MGAENISQISHHHEISGLWEPAPGAVDRTGVSTDFLRGRFQIITQTREDDSPGVVMCDSASYSLSSRRSCAFFMFLLRSSKVLYTGT